MAIAVGNSTSGLTTTITRPAAASGDYIIAVALRDGSNNPPNIPTGWTAIQTKTGDSTGAVLAYIVSDGSTPSETFGSATSVVMTAYSGVTGLGASGQTTTIGTTINWSALTLTGTNGGSWIVLGAVTRADGTTVTAENPPTGFTNRVVSTDTTDETALHDSNGGVSSFTGASASIGGASTGNVGFALELLGAAAGGGGGTPAPTSGSASGAATVSGSANAVISSGGSANGQATVSGTGRTVVSAAGTASGQASATGQGNTIVSAAGSASSSATVSGSTASNGSSGSAAGSASVVGSANIIVSATGSASGSSVVVGSSNGSPVPNPPQQIVGGIAGWWPERQSPQEHRAQQTERASRVRKAYAAARRQRKRLKPETLTALLELVRLAQPAATALPPTDSIDWEWLALSGVLPDDAETLLALALQEGRALVAPQPAPPIIAAPRIEVPAFDDEDVAIALLLLVA
jgi:hypothetical protein